MKGLKTFYLIVNTFVITAMFFGITKLLPLLESIPINIGVKYAITTFSTIGIYKLIFTLLEFLFNRLRWLRKIIIGRAYIEGTWIGEFSDENNNKYFTIEKFEQSFDEIKLLGIAYDRNGEYARWKSIAITVDEKNGTISYHYNCDMTRFSSTHSGIANFNFDTINKHTPPQLITGYSADLTNGIRTTNSEKKISDKLLPIAEVLSKYYPN